MPGFGPDPSSLFSVFFVVALGIIIFGIVSNIVEWSRNQASEVRMRNVRVVAKRTTLQAPACIIATPSTAAGAPTPPITLPLNF